MGRLLGRELLKAIAYLILSNLFSYCTTGKINIVFELLIDNCSIV